MPALFPALRKSVAFLAILTAAGACQQHEQSGAPEAYVENGVLWAYGSVQLTRMDAPGAVMIKRTADVQTVDTPAFQLYGAIQAATGAGGERDVAYVDWHQTNNRLLAYAWQIDYQQRSVNQSPSQSMIDVYAVLKKPGRSYHARHRVYLGSALFQNGAGLATLTLAEGLKLSLIADGVFAGQWAMHYADAPMVVTRPWQGICPKGVSQMPGQTPGQNPGQFDQCRPLPPQQDLCEGNPTQAGCRPKPPTQQKPGTGDDGRPPLGFKPVFDLGELEVIDGDEGVFALPAETKAAKIVFVSETLAAGNDEENAALCAKRFYAVGRTVGRQVNTACVLKPAPATARDGKLACGVTVAFEQAQTYLEKVCDVTAVFRGAKLETQTVQILKR